MSPSVAIHAVPVLGTRQSEMPNLVAGVAVRPGLKVLGAVGMNVVTIPRVDCSYVFFFYMFHHFPPTSPAVPVHDPSGRHVI